MIEDQFDCIVVGGGPAGLAAAAALRVLGMSVAVAAEPASTRSPNVLDIGANASPSRPPPAVETRTSALFPPAIALLQNLGAWKALKPASASLAGIRLVDDTGSLLRAPELMFSASELALDNLGYNVPNAALTEALANAARRNGVTLFEDGRVTAVTFNGDAGVVTLADGRQQSASLVVAADGRNSITREAAGIAPQRWTYDQSALACRFDHSRPHNGISSELHGPAGPCTTVPLPGNASSLVWMERPPEIDRLCAMPPADFLGILANRLGGLLGALSNLGARRSFPLSGLLASTMAQNRVALVGEAAHALPPIGAQGLNLGLVDAATLADHVAAARKAGQDIGGAEVLAGYDRARRADVRRRAGAVDLLNRSLHAGLGPLNLARGAGLHVMAAMPSLRRRLMLEGLYPPPPIPTLMRVAVRDFA